MEEGDFMKDFVTVNIHKDDLLDMIMERVCFWDKGRKYEDLYKKMYESYVCNSVFENIKLDIHTMVDNDVINYTSVLEESDEEFSKVFKLGKIEVYDISLGTSYFFIEAISDDNKKILVRKKYRGNR